MDPHQALKTLGVHLAMDGNFEEQTEALHRKTTQFADCIRTGFVTRMEAWIALKSTIWKAIEYPMEAVTLTRNNGHT